MKTYFRLLSFARPIEKYAIPYIVFTLLSIIFSTLNLALLAPLLTTLFNSSGKVAAPVKPSGFFDVFNQLNYYSYYASERLGVFKTLQIVCGIIILSVFLGN